MAKSADTILSRIKDEEIDWVDLRFTDPKGKWQHLTMCSSVIDDDALTDGLMFDGSSIEGWKAINESDMILKPDLDAAYVDPFSATPMMVLFCNVVEPSTGELYGRDPRSTANRAEAYLKQTGIADTVFVGPEAEFFMFDDVRFEDGYNASGYRIDDIELPTNTMREYEGGNLAHRPRAKGGYFPVAPVDSAMDIRGEMVSTMLEMGLPMDKHHHEVAASQHELGLTYGGLVQTADGREFNSKRSGGRGFDHQPRKRVRIGIERKKLPNRMSRGSQFGYEDFAAFCALSATVDRPVTHMVRGHDHVDERYEIYPAYARTPVLTTIAISRRLGREMFGPYVRVPTVARWIRGSLPQVYRLHIPEQWVRKSYPEETGETESSPQPGRNHL